MALDLKALRDAYFASPRPGPPDHIPTREEYIAQYERRAVNACLAVGGDPVAEGLGEHGSLIGGPDKPLRVLPAHPENRARMEPMPLSWFAYPQAKVPVYNEALEDPEDRGHPLARKLAGTHLAGVPQRPTPGRLAEMLQAPELSRSEAFVLYQLFGTMYVEDLRRLLSDERLTVYELARAIRLSGTRRTHVVRWINQFAVRPDAGDETKQK